MEKCTIVCGYHAIISKIENSFLIGVDRGALNLIEKGYVPDISVGDFDSVSEEELNKIKNNSKSFTKLNPIKDDTDLEHALAICKDYKFAEIHIYGCLGGRQDHSLLNIKFVYQSKENIFLHDDRNEIFKLEKGIHHIKKNNYKYMSIFTFQESKISLKNVKYELNDATITFLDNYTTSNEILNDECEIDVLDGKILVILCNDGLVL